VSKIEDVTRAGIYFSQDALPPTARTGGFLIQIVAVDQSVLSFPTLNVSLFQV